MTRARAEEIARFRRCARTSLDNRDAVLEMCLEESRETGDPMRRNDAMAIRVMTGMILELAAELLRLDRGEDADDAALDRLRSSGEDLSILADLIK